MQPKHPLQTPVRCLQSVNVRHLLSCVCAAFSASLICVMWYFGSISPICNHARHVSSSLARSLILSRPPIGVRK